MADKRIVELPAAPGVYDDTLLVAEQQGQAVKITAGQLRSGLSSSGQGVGLSMAGETVEPIQGEKVAGEYGAEIFNDYRERKFSDDGSVESGNIASGKCSHAEGGCTTASGECSHAEGILTTASGSASHSEGGYLEGGKHSEAAGYAAHAEGASTTASGKCSHAEGVQTAASGNASHAGGLGTIASGAVQTAIGQNNVEYAGLTAQYINLGAWFIIGKGDSGSARSNAFRVASTGVYASGSYNASGADYAEMFEWADGNPDKEDRRGLFVTLDGAKIRLAEPKDDYILGVVSGNPSVVGDVHDDQWQGMYLCDIFGRPLWEAAEVPEQKDDSGRVISPICTERRQKLNPDYDNTQKYTPRSERPEWDAVGMLGKLVAVDDGSCAVNGWCAVGEGGVATASENRTKYRVMERLDESHVRVMIL